MNREAVGEALKQIIEGYDFDTSKRLVNVKADVACHVPASCPYSMATNVWHCDFWNRLWLARLLGEKRPSGNIYKMDWHVPSAAEWPATKDTFLANIQKAYEIATAEPFQHAMENDIKAVEKLCQIAVHTAYHVGQIALIKRMAKAELKAAKE